LPVAAAMAEPSQRQPATKNVVKQEAAITVFELLMMGGVSPENIEQFRNIGIIIYPTMSHLVGSFYEIYITMHESMNIIYITMHGSMNIIYFTMHGSITNIYIRMHGSIIIIL
jgi:hypothetical protein